MEETHGYLHRVDGGQRRKGIESRLECTVLAVAPLHMHVPNVCKPSFLLLSEASFLEQKLVIHCHLHRHPLQVTAPDSDMVHWGDCNSAAKKRLSTARPGAVYSYLCKHTQTKMWHCSSYL